MFYCCCNKTLDKSQKSHRESFVTLVSPRCSNPNEQIVLKGDALNDIKCVPVIPEATRGQEVKPDSGKSWFFFLLSYCFSSDLKLTITVLFWNRCSRPDMATVCYHWHTCLVPRHHHHYHDRSCEKPPEKKEDKKENSWKNHCKSYR